jgi:hypothetical protein
LNCDFVRAGAGESVVEELQDLSREDFACNGAGIGAGIVGEAPFVCVGESAQLREDFRCDEIGGVVVGCVVDLGDVD